MSEKETLKKIGIVSDAHGIRGELYILVFSGDTSWLLQTKEIMLKNPNSDDFKKLKIKKSKPFKKGFLASFFEVSDRNQAEELKKYEVWLSESLFVSQDGDQPFLTELINFEVFDKTLGSIGRVIQFSSNGLQDLLVLDQIVNQQNVEIPFVKEFVLSVDYKAKEIHADLPEGLVRINEKD